MKADVEKTASSQTAMLVKKNATKLEKLKMAPIGLLQQVIRTANKSNLAFLLSLCSSVITWQFYRTHSESKEF